MTERTYTADEVREIVASELDRLAEILTPAHEVDRYTCRDHAEGMKFAAAIVRYRANCRRASIWAIP